MANTTPEIIYSNTAELIGIKNGVNNIFTTPSIFIQSPAENIYISVLRSGVVQKIDSDYIIFDDGSGYNTIIFKRPPRKLEHLTCNYLPNEGV